MDGSGTTVPRRREDAVLRKALRLTRRLLRGEFAVAATPDESDGASDRARQELRVRSRSFARWIALAAGAFASAGLADADQLFVSTFGAGLTSDEIVHIDLATGAQNTVVSGLLESEDGACQPATGLIYFAESIPGRVTRWDQAGGNPTSIVPAVGIIDGPEGLSFDLAGNLYLNTREVNGVAQGAWLLASGDPANLAMPFIPPFTLFGEGTEFVLAGPQKGALLLVARGEQQVYLSQPPGTAPVLFIDATAFPPGVDLYGISSNGCGDVFVTFKDTLAGTGAVYHFAPNGSFIEVYASGLTAPTFTEFDSAGNLYVADNIPGTIWKVAPDKARTAFASLTNAHGLAMCRDKAIPDCPVVLSCHYGSWSAVRDDQGVRVTWTTTMESNTVGFEVWARDVQGIETRLAMFTLATGGGSAYELRDGRAEAHDGRTTAYRVVERSNGGVGDATAWIAVSDGPRKAGRTRHRARRP